MHPRARRLSACVELADVRFAETVYLNSADHIMGAGSHRNQIRGNIDTERGADFLDLREAGIQPFLGDVADVEVHARMPGLLHFRQNTLADNVSGRQFGLRMVVGHKPHAFAVSQYPAFSSHRFGDQESHGAGNVEGGRVELDEFHVLKDCAGAISHGNPVARSNVWIGRFPVNLPTPTGGQYRPLGPN